jgi:hypothetical protein
VILGCFNLTYGIAAIANSHVFTASLRTWGWITLIIGALQLLAAAGVVAGNQMARWFAVLVLGFNAIDQMFFVPAYPFWSLMIIAGRRGRAVRAVRLRQPRQPRRLGPTGVGKTELAKTLAAALFDTEDNMVRWT